MNAAINASDLLAGRPDKTPAASAPGEIGRREWVLAAFFAMQVLSVTVLQKFGLPVGGDVMELAVFTTWVGVGVLALNGLVALDLIRLILFCVFTLVAVTSQLLGAEPFSLNSVFLALALYAPFALRFNVSAAFYRRCMAIFLNVMLVMGALVVVQQLMQLSVGWRAWPDVDKLAPHQLLFSGYNYLQPVAYGSRFFKPNAFLFLEDSFVSQFIAMALLIELVLFQRMVRLAFYALVLMICFAGTGLLLLALCAPFIVAKLSPRLLIGLVLIAAVGAIAATAVGWFGQVSQRFGEVGVQGSSGYYRFNVPFQVVAQMAQDPQYAFTGHGAGSTGSGQGQAVAGFILVPFAKIIYEYGFLTFFAFYAFFIWSLFASSSNRLLAWALFVFYNLGGGGFVVPVYVVTCQALGTLLRVERPEATQAARHLWRRRRPLRRPALA